MQNISKRTILWIVPILIIAIFWYFYGPQEEITDNEYITYIKESSINETKHDTLEDTLANACEKGKWIYFRTQKNHNVVEFKGSCEVDGNVSDVNLQFVVENEQTNYQVGALLLDGVQQSEAQRNEFLNIIAAN